MTNPERRAVTAPNGTGRRNRVSGREGVKENNFFQQSFAAFTNQGLTNPSPFGEQGHNRFVEGDLLKAANIYQ